MGVTWDDIAATLYGLSSFVIDAGPPYGVANEAELTDRWVADVQERVEQAFPAVPTQEALQQAPSPLQARSQTVPSPNVLRTARGDRPPAPGGSSLLLCFDHRDRCAVRSLATLLPAPTRSAQDFSTGFAEYYGNRMIITQRVVWDGPWKLVFSGFDYDELYNLERDPWEMDNLAQDPVYGKQLRAMLARMWATVRDTGDRSLYNSHYPILRVAPFGPRIAEESTGRGGPTQ